MSPFLEVLRSGRVLLMDGAMGTELQKAGLRDDENGAAWNVLHPERVRAVHQAYRDAGAEVFLTNTFMIHAPSFDETLEAADRYPEMLHPWESAFDVLGDAGPYHLACLGPFVGPSPEPEFNSLAGFHFPSRGSQHDADAILLETCSSPRVRFAIRRIGRRPDVLLSLSFLRHKSGELVTQSGHSLEWFAQRAGDYGIAALGVNCGRDIGMDDIIDIVRRYRSMTNLPLFARPNAGTPTRQGDRWVYPLTPEAMAARLPELLEAGVCMVGGCCGTTPAHIAALRPIIDEWNARGKS